MYMYINVYIHAELFKVKINLGNNLGTQRHLLRRIGIEFRISSRLSINIF